MTSDILKGIKGVIFDLDGTLIDSMWMWRDIDIEYLSRHGKPFSENLQKEIEGMSFTETAVYFKETYALSDSIEKIKADWTAMSLDKYTNEVKLKPYALDFLRFLKGKHIKTGIATSNGREMVEACLSSLGVTDCFDVVVTACEVAHGKPEPDIYECVAKKLSLTPKQCLVFEDIPAGIIAGKRAGMTVVAVQDAFSREMEAEKRVLADGFIEDFSALLP